MKTSVLILAASFVCFAAAQCSYNSPSGKVDLSAVPTATLQIDQTYNGVQTPQMWVINLCAAVNQPPAGAAPCTNGSGYISEYSSTQCETTWTTQTQGWSYDSTKWAGSASFTNSKGWLATILIGCGSAPGLMPAANVVVTDSMAFTFLLTTSAACGGAPPSPPGPPPPNPPPAPAPSPPATNGTVTRLMCKESGCRQCTGDVLPIGSCFPASASSTASEKVVSCSSQTVTIDTWSSSSSCGNSFFPAQTLWPVGKCIAVGPSDYRFYMCSP